MAIPSLNDGRKYAADWEKSAEMCNYIASTESTGDIIARHRKAIIAVCRSWRQVQPKTLTKLVSEVTMLDEEHRGPIGCTGVRLAPVMFPMNTPFFNRLKLMPAIFIVYCGPRKVYDKEQHSPLFVPPETFG